MIKSIKSHSKLILLLSFILLVGLSLTSYSNEEPGEMILVEAGTTSDDNGSVTVYNDFYIGKYHVTQAEFEDVMGFNPSYFNDNDHPNLKGNSINRPVENVTWYDAVKYANKLSEREGLEKYYNINDIEYKGDDEAWAYHPNNIDIATVTENITANGYRLPKEDEHEYAARGGRVGNSTTYAGSDNLDEVGWYEGNSDVANSSGDNKRGTMPVGERKANELGLYDMSGNVFDWTNSTSGSDRIVRGGSWFGDGNDGYDYACEVGHFESLSPSSFTNAIGFRLTRRP